MLIAIAYCDKDVDQAIRLADWLRELGPYPNHSLLVARDSSTQVRPFADVGFASVEEIVITDDVWHSWPQSANNAFKKVATHIEYGVAQPWFWLEPDAVPMRKGCLDEIEAEYKSCGKPFLGDYVSVHTPELDVIDHMSGVAVYPGKMTNFAGEAKLAVELAWDVFAAHQIVPTMATSELIMHSWKHEPFADWEQVEREIFAFKPKCALFHADKSGSLYPLLRARMILSGSVESRHASGATSELPSLRATDARNTVGGDVGGLPGASGQNVPVAYNRSGSSAPPAQNLSSAPVHNQKSGEATSTGAEAFTEGSSVAEHSGAPANGIAGVAGSIPAPLICDILIKSYPPDYELLRYCMRSIDKFARGFRRVILITPKVPDGSRESIGLFVHGVLDDFIPAIPRTPVKWIEVEETGDGYLFQQAVKINAHEYTDADYILHIDSDTMLTKPVTPETFVKKKILWLMTPYENTETPWQPITEKFLGEPVEFEFMRRAPQFIPRSLHVSADVFCRVKHRMSLTQYILGQTNREFSEFNALGALAYSRARDDFSWLDTTKEKLPEAVAKQFWSHDPLTDERRAEFETILSGSSKVEQPVYNRQVEGSTPSPTTIRQTAAGIWIIDGDTHISAWVEEKGQLQHDYQTLPLILAEINEGDVVVDVGANIGDSTAPFLDRVGTEGEVYAFEPNKDAYECLKRNCPRALHFCIALDQYSGKSFSSLEPNDNAGARCLTQSEVGQAVRCDTLDASELHRCDFIKIDVEGYELNVLRGAEKTINKFRPKMAIELNEGALQRQGTSAIEVLTWLYDHGYYCWPLVPPDRNQKLPQYDILCRPLSDWKPRARSENSGAEAIVPWADKEESLAEVSRLCGELKKFCNAPAHTNRVRKELKKARVI